MKWAKARQALVGVIFLAITLGIWYVVPWILSWT